MKSVKFSVAICIVIVFNIFFSTFAGAATVDNNYISSQGACVMDYETGEVLYEYCGYINRSPASMTKVMSLYCIFRELDNQGISLDTVVPISSRVYSMPSTTDYQCIPLYSGVSYTVDQLIGAVATYSASNALVALVELVAGTEANFVTIMNNTANEMGLGAYYYDSCGGYTNHVSPVAMAMLARNIIRDYPQIIERTSKRYIVFNGVTYYSTNKLYTSYSYEGIDGLKTGTSNSAGYCLCATGVRNGRRIITVTMGSASNYYRFNDSIMLLDYGFKTLDQRYNEILSCTDTSVFFNGYEVPALCYSSAGSNSTVIPVKSLIYYGFDVDYSESTNTVTIKINKDKKITPASCEGYKGPVGLKISDVQDKGDLRIFVKNGYDMIKLKDICKVGNAWYVSAEEFGNAFDLYQDGNTINVNYSNNFEEIKSQSVLRKILINPTTKIAVSED